MNSEVRTQWLEALRSGEYKQGQGKLHADDKFCCLGVLCDLAVKNGVPIRIETDSLLRTHYDSHDNYLPSSVTDWAELDNPNPRIQGARSLAASNDSGSSFEEIADLIEEYL